MTMTNANRTVQFKIYRYDPDQDAKPYMQDIAVELESTDRKLLDAMVKLKAQDDSISFRRSCREGVCGSDAMNINGKNGLACLTAMDSFPEGKPIVLRPLPGLPVIRDLIVDMTQFFKQYNSIKPYLINNDPPPGARAPAVAGGPRGTQRSLRVHPLCMLLDGLSVVLVEPGQVRRPGRLAGGLPLHRRHARPGDQRASRQPRRSLSPVPLPHHHELRRCLSEGPEPDQGDRQDQGDDG
jgi:hypothetical protein